MEASHAPRSSSARLSSACASARAGAQAREVSYERLRQAAVNCTSTVSVFAAFPQMQRGALRGMHSWIATRQR